MDRSLLSLDIVVYHRSYIFKKPFSQQSSSTEGHI